jgi:hypothetical protein
MSMISVVATAGLVLCALAEPLPAQVAASGPQQAGAVLNAEDEVHRAARIALTGTLGFPPLPEVRADSPRDLLIFADRFPALSPSFDMSPPSAPTMVSSVLSKAETGTGFPEIFEYQLGSSYTPTGTPHVLVVAQHGFGMSAASVANQSTIDEECNARGFVYVAATGLDDQLFGSPISQIHIESVIQFMLNSFNVDPDRIYMVGFSAGAGVAVNFAARHRDPDGIMIAGLGAVSTSLDWTKTYNLGNVTTQLLMENPYNFNGSPTAEPFRYRQASGLFFTESSYPPLPGLVELAESMATNLGDIPTYITYDDGDQLPTISGNCETLFTVLQGLGASPTKVVQTGTVDGGGQPAPHSWAVLDVDELFDFWGGLSVVRYPVEIEAQQDLGGPTAWVSTTQAASGGFTYFDATADSGSGLITLLNVANASDVVIDVTSAGISGMPRITAVANVGQPYTLRITNLSSAPSYLLDSTGGTLITLVDSDPATGSLIVDVAAGTSLEFDVVSDPQWTSVLTSSPNPVSIGTSSSVALDCPSSATNAWLIVALQELLLNVKGVTLTASPIPPAILTLLPLNLDGDLSFPATIPNDPLFIGLRIPVQVLALDSQNTPFSVSNLWGFRID